MGLLCQETQSVYSTAPVAHMERDMMVSSSLSQWINANKPGV